MRALANTTPSEPISWKFGHTLGGRASTARCFSTFHTNYWWPHQADGDKSEDSNPRPDADLIEDAWKTAFVQQQPSRKPDLQRRIHILGIGAIGLLIAHSLAGIPNRPPITFLAGSRAAVHRFRASGQRIELVTNGFSDIRGGFDIEQAYNNAEDHPRYPHVEFSGPQASGLFGAAGRYRLADALNAVKANSAPEAVLPVEKSLVDEESGADDTATLDASRDAMGNEAVLPNAKEGKDYLSSSSDDQGFISNLIVSLRSKDVLCLANIAHRLTEESVILFVQNGMGYIEDVNERIFPDPRTRPTYIVGVANHGVSRPNTYTVVHSGHGTIALGVLPRVGSEPTDSLSPSARYLLQTITRTPVLAAVAYGPTDILQYQFEKLAAQSVLQPMTAVLECTHGELLRTFHISRMIKLVLAEISFVVRSLPELQNVPNIQSRFDPGRLELYVNHVAYKTSRYESSMLRDIRNGRGTDIDYLNGYVFRKGEELGIRCVMNYMLMQMVEAKQQVVTLRDSESLPIGGQDSLMLPRR